MYIKMPLWLQRLFVLVLFESLIGLTVGWMLANLIYDVTATPHQPGIVQIGFFWAAFIGITYKPVIRFLSGIK